MTDKKPNDMVVALRQLAAASSTPKSITEYPLWFQEEWNKDMNGCWANMLLKAADELENMQKLNGRLYKTLYPD